MQDNVTQADARGIFKGSNEQLCNSIDALLDLNDKGAVSHRVPGMAVTLLEAAHARLASTTAQSEAVQKLAEAADVAQGDAHMLRRAIEAGDPVAELLVRVSDIDNGLRQALAAHRESQP